MSDPDNNDVQEAIRIYAACSKLKLSDRITRLHTYIHMMCLSKDQGIEQFSQNQADEIAAIGYLMGEVDFTKLIQSMNDENLNAEQKSDIYNTLEKKLIDKKEQLKQKEIEELIDRLKLYTDQNFRDTQLSEYTQRVIPCFQTTSYEQAQTILENNQKA